MTICGCIGGCGRRRWRWRKFFAIPDFTLPWARQNFVDQSVTDQTSITRFVEDNWLGGQRIGQGSFDGIANSITQMFNFSKIRHDGTLFLNPSTGEKE
jgi:phospholipase C